jgi:hypothetical protein
LQPGGHPRTAGQRGRLHRAAVRWARTGVALGRTLDPRSELCQDGADRLRPSGGLTGSTLRSTVPGEVHGPAGRGPPR